MTDLNLTILIIGIAIALAIILLAWMFAGAVESTLEDERRHRGRI